MFTAIKPSLRIDLQLLVGGVVAAEFDAAIWEPADAASPGRVELACTSRFEAINAMAAGPFQLRGVLGDTTVIANDVWMRSFEHERHPDRRHARPRLHLDQIYELEIARRHPETSPGGNRQLEYLLTPCKPLNPASIVERHPNGTVNCTTVHRVEFEHPSLGLLSFDQRHGLVETEPGVRSETTTLTLQLASPVPFCTPLAEVDERVREALHLAGFAARYPTRIWGRHWEGEGALSRTYFQALSSRTPHWRQQTAHDPLVPKSELAAFLTLAAGVVAQYSPAQQDSLRTALLVARSENGTLEDQFRAVFSALEGLCKEFADAGEQRLSAGERARSRKTRVAVKAALDALKKADPAIEVEKTLARLERTSVPPDRRFRAFVEKFTVPVDDMWPAYRDANPGADLYEIRNRLSHGAYFSEGGLNAVHVALEHLKLLVERCVLSLLGWDVERSAASHREVEAFMPFRETLALKATLV